MYLDWKKLKKEMKSLMIQIRLAKAKVRSRDLNANSKRKELCQARTEWGIASTRFTKLCVLRSLVTGKRHLSPNTKLGDFYGVKSLDFSDLKEWVKPETAEFIAVFD